ncbi:DEAD/DEAH box helicase [Myroides odoratimimus]|uniref:DEAD/DEAH box helicase n=1 Tax=Myroides odoratimimus TaxID=76832 RepID=UPI002577525C|nr:DEAD/DEAH box helicase [Myroides odoratimimus]MDM1064977.1 DEAD/DEAH box helicase [Myroides odoratimimus]
MNNFEQLGLNESLLSAIKDMGFENPSEIQQKAIPLLLEKDTDIVALAQTGTGKTAAFGFPLIQKIDVSNKNTQGLILSPTRELCLQIANEIKQYSKYVKGLHSVAVYGGASITEQAKDVKRGAQIIVATPGRMQDMINRGMVNIKNINYCILDEADEMLNMGFYEDITSILADTPKEKNTWLFSATMPQEVARIAREFMKTPEEITVGHKNQGNTNVSHEFYLVSARDRYPALKRLADANPDIFSVVFCRTKRDTQSIAEKLIEDGYNAAALHGDLSQAQRDAVMKSFRGKQIQMLVATDVAARGIDVDDITHVVNYQLPDEIETYTHRSGRTGRAGKSGTSMVIVTKSELRKIQQIERIIKTKFEEKPVPSGIEICEIQLFHLANRIKEVEVNTEIEAYLPAITELLKDFDKEEIIKKVVSVEFNRFLEYYQKASNSLSSVSAGRNNSKEVPTDGAVRFFVNLGAKDNLDWMTLKDFLRDTLELGRDDLFKVDVKDGFSFFNTEAEHAEKVMETLNGLEYQGRRVNVEISNNDGGRNGGRRDHNNRKSGFRGGERRSEGGFRGGERRSSNRSSEGGFRGGERRSDRSSSEGRGERRSDKSSERAPRNERGSRRSSEGDSSRRTRRN